MTERFQVYKTIGQFHAWYINDNYEDIVVVDNIMHKYDADRLCAKLNQLNNDNMQLKQTSERQIQQLLEENQQLLEETRQYTILTDELKRQNKKLKARLNDLGVEYYD